MRAKNWKMLRFLSLAVCACSLVWAGPMPGGVGSLSLSGALDSLGHSADDLADAMSSMNMDDIDLSDVMDHFDTMSEGEVLDLFLDTMTNMSKNEVDMSPVFDLWDGLSEKWDDMTEDMKNVMKGVAGDMDCDDMKMAPLADMGDVFLMNMNISGMSMGMCMDVIGNVSLSMNQSKAIMHAARMAFGSFTRNWKKSDILSMGPAMLGLDKSLLMEMSPDLDVFNMFAKFDDMDEEQAEAMYAMAETLFGDVAFEDLPIDPWTMGPAICAAPTYKFMNMSSNLFQDMVEFVGNMHICKPEILETMAEKAKMQYGRVDTWDGNRVGRLGAIMGALSSDEIRGLTDAQIRGLKPDSVPHFPAEMFAAFNQDQLSKLPQDKLAELDDDVMRLMDPTLKTFLKGLRGDDMGGAPQPGGGGTFNPDFDASAPSKDALTGGNLNVDQLKELDAQDFRDLDITDIENMAGSYDDSMKQELCKTMMVSGDTGMLDILGRSGIDCLDHMGSLDTKISSGAAKEMLNQKMDSAPPRDWDENDWGTVFSAMGDAVDPSTIKEMDSTVMRSMVAQKSFSPDSMSRPDQKRAMSEQIEAAFGEAANWGASDLADLAEGDFLGKLVDHSDLRKMDPADIASSLSSFSDVDFDDSSKKGAVAKLVKEGLGGRDSANTWSADDIKGAAQYIMEDMGVLQQVSLDTLRNSLSNFSSHIGQREDAMGLGKRLKEMTDFQSPQNLDQAKLGEIASFLPAMGKSYMKDLDAAAIVGNLQALGQADFTPGDAKAMIEKMSGSINLATLDAAGISEMGNLMTGFAKAELEQMPGASLDDPAVLANMANLNMGPSKARAVLAKLKSNNGGSKNLGPNAKVLGSMMKQVGRSELEATSVSDFGLRCDDADTMALSPDAAQSRVLMKRLKEEYGEMISSNTNYTSSCFSRWGKIAAQGMAKEDIDNLRTDAELKGIAEQMGSYEEEMDETQGRAMCKKIKAAMLTNDNDFKNMDEATIEQVGKFFKYLDDADLEKFNKSMKPTIARKLGEANMDNVKKSEIQRLKKFALKYILRSENSSVEDRRDVAQLDDNDIRDMGNLRCGLELADMQKLSKDAIENNVFDMSKKCGFDADVGKALLDKAEEKVTDLFTSSDGAVMVSGLLPHASDTQLNTISTAVWEESFSDISDAIEERSQVLEKRDVSFSSERDTTQRSDETTAVKSAMSTALAAYSAAGTSSRRRRKRNTAYSCSDISLLGDLTTLTTSDIDSLSTTDFEDCSETLGQEANWDSDQLSSLATKAKSAWGTVDTWTSTEVQSAGSIVAGLTADEIRSLAIDADAMSSIGAYDIFTSDQLAKGYLAYLEVTSVTSSALTADDLISLGSFVCGATESNIGDFGNAAYYDAASTIGDQTQCNSGQLAALATIAKNNAVYGASSTWDSSVITTVGSVIGGLTSSEIGALTESQISAIGAADMSLIPAATFAGFSATQIGYFTTSQASAVTSDQEAALSSDAQDALNAILGTTSTNGDSGAAFVTWSVMLLAVSAVMNRL